ncbi:MAG: RNA polymerase sigma factor [Acidimicrobiia bacterium]
MSNCSEAKSGERIQERFDHLFERHFDEICRYCVRRLGVDDGEDAAAEVFAVAWRRIDDMPTDSAVRPWLYGVAFRVVGNQYRGRRRRARLTRRLESDLVGPGGRVGSGGDTHSELVLVALGKLSDVDQELLRLHSWDGLTRTEIAQVLGINENAVDQRLHRARTRLRARFEQLEPRTRQTQEENS